MPSGASIHKVVIGGIAHRAVPEPLIDAVGCRIRQISEQKAEAVAVLEEAPSQLSYARRRIATPPARRRRVYEIYPHAVRRLSSPRRHRHRFGSLPEKQHFLSDPARCDLGGIDELGR